MFYYFLREQVKALVRAMAQAFGGGRLVFDAAGPSAVRLMLKTWIKTAEIQNVGAYFSVRDAKTELQDFAPGMTISSRGYMLGYHDLRLPCVPPLYRFLSRVGDTYMRMQIVKLTFPDARQSAAEA